MGVEELERIKAYGARLEEGRRKASEPPVPEPVPPWAADNPVVSVMDGGLS